MDYNAYLREIEKIKQNRTAVFTDNIKNLAVYKEMQSYDSKLTEDQQKLQELISVFDACVIDAEIVSPGIKPTSNPIFHSKISQLENLLREIENQINIVFYTK